MTIEEFGQSVKGKYSQYSQYSDLEIGQRMLQKYPQYQNRISGNTTAKKPGGNFLTGLAKSGLSTAKGTLELGLKGARAILPKAVEPPEDFLSEENLQKNVLGFEKFLTKEATTPRGTAEKVGKFAGDVAQFAIPGTKVSKATQALSAIPRIAARAGVSGAIGAAQTGTLKGGGIAAGVEAVAPVAGKVIKTVASPAVKLVGRLLKGTSAGLSGASSSQLDAILKDPKAAKRFIQEIKRVGGAEALRKESRAIVQGVSSVRQEARKAFGEGLEQLSEADIKPNLFREHAKSVLDKFGSQIVRGERVLKNVEFDDPKNLQKASDLVSKLSKVKLDGKSLRKLADDIENSAYKIATDSNEKQAFNAFVKDLSGTLKDAISRSTDKLDDINKAFSGEMQLVEEIQSIFGKVKFKNAKEILTVSQRLENLFSRKGLAPDAIDRFLQRIGISPTEFRAGEATRQIGELGERANTVGTNPFEIIRSVTSAIVPPKAVRDIAIATGIGIEAAKELATKLSPVVRSIIVRSLLGVSGNPGPNEENDAKY